MRPLPCVEKFVQSRNMKNPYGAMVSQASLTSGAKCERKFLRTINDGIGSEAARKYFCQVKWER